MTYGTGTKSEFDDVRHGYAPPREHSRSVPHPQPEIRTEDVELGFVDEQFQQSGDVDGSYSKHSVSDSAEERPTIGDSVQDLVDSGKAAYRAELNLFKARADVIISASKRAAVFTAISAGAGLVFLLALGVGSIIVLAQHIDPAVAVLIVVTILGLISGCAAYLAKQQYDRMTDAFGERDGDE